MKIPGKIISTILLCLLLFGCGRETALEGKVVDAKGQPIANVKVIATQVQPIKGYEKLEATTDSHGTFHIGGVFPNSKYVLFPWAKEWTASPMTATYKSAKEQAYFSKQGWTDDQKIVVKTGPKGQTALLVGPLVVQPVVYFPLQEGMVWKYEVELPNLPSHTWVSKALPAQEWGEIPIGNPLYGRKLIAIETDFDFPYSGKVYNYYGADKHGIFTAGSHPYVVHSSSPVYGIIITILPIPKYIIKGPVQIGTTWTNTSKNSKFTFQSHITIESINDTVTVPAGTFHNCLKIKEAVFRQDGNTLNKLRHEFMWFAPNIGEVKHINSSDYGKTTTVLLEVRFPENTYLTAPVSATEVATGEAAGSSGPSDAQIKQALFADFRNGGLPLKWRGSLMGYKAFSISDLRVLERGKSLKSGNGGHMPEIYGGQFQNCWPIMVYVKGISTADLLLGNTKDVPFYGKEEFLVCKDNFGKWSAQVGQE